MYTAYVGTQFADAPRFHRDVRLPAPGPHALGHHLSVDPVDRPLPALYREQGASGGL